MYQPDELHDTSLIGRYLQRELHKLSGVLSNLDIESLNFKVWHVEPDKPRTGQVYYADGSDWSPGAGEGLYERLSTGLWSKL